MSSVTADGKWKIPKKVQYLEKILFKYLLIFEFRFPSIFYIFSITLIKYLRHKKNIFILNYRMLCFGFILFE